MRPQFAWDKELLHYWAWLSQEESSFMQDWDTKFKIRIGLHYNQLLHKLLPTFPPNWLSSRQSSATQARLRQEKNWTAVQIPNDNWTWQYLVRSTETDSGSDWTLCGRDQPSLLGSQILEKVLRAVRNISVLILYDNNDVVCPISFAFTMCASYDRTDDNDKCQKITFKIRTSLIWKKESKCWIFYSIWRQDVDYVTIL